MRQRPGQRQRAHLACAGLFEHARARIERGRGGHDVVDEHEHPVLDPAAACRAAHPRGDGEGAADVSPPLGRREPGLRRACGAPARARCHRHAQRARKIGRLIEAAVQPLPRVQRHRHDRIAAIQHGPACIPQQRAERARERPAAVVFERVDDRAQLALVVTGDGAGVERRWATAAGRAAFSGGADGAPRRQRLATDAARRRQRRADAQPARRTHRALERTIEHGVAGGARGPSATVSRASSARTAAARAPQAALVEKS